MAYDRFRAPRLPNPPPVYNFRQQEELVRALELYFNLIDSKTPQRADQYTADRFIGGYFSTGIEAVTASGTLGTNSGISLVDASGGAVTITLPAAAASLGREVTVKKTDVSANAVTIDGNGSETIDGATTASITTAYTAIKLICDGTEWWTI